MLKSRLSKRAASGWLLGSSLAVVLGALFWPRARLAEEAASHVREPGPSRPGAAARGASVAPSQAAPRSATALARVHADAEPALDDGKTPMEPHPADPARAALIPPWAAFEDVESALAKRDFDGARAQLELRRKQDPNPDDWRDFYEGLDLLRECMEEPGGASRARAESFIAEYRASPLRRHVRRACITPAR